MAEEGSNAHDAAFTEEQLQQFLPNLFCACSETQKGHFKGWGESDAMAEVREHEARVDNVWLSLGVYLALSIGFWL